MGFSAGVGFLVDTDGDGTNDGKVVTLKKGSNITLSLTGSTLTIASTGGSGAVRTVTVNGTPLESSESLDLLAGEGIDISESGGDVTIAGEDATDTNKGIASFSSDNFSVTSGAVTIKAEGVDLTAEVTGTLPVTNGGTGASSLNNLITLGTHTTGNYVATIADSGGGTITVANSGSEEAGVTLAVDTSVIASKTYVDSVAQGLRVADPVVVATTNNITLSGEQTIDGITTSASRVLVKDQSDQKTNGIYVSASGGWVRASDMDADTSPNEFPGTFVFVSGGTANADTGWVCTVDTDFDLGTDNVTFSQFSSAGHITAGSGLAKTGNTIDLSIANGSDNRVITATGTDNVNAEANLTFDGTDLVVTGSIGINEADPDTALHLTSSANGAPIIKLENTATDEDASSEPEIIFQRTAAPSEEGDHDSFDIGQIRWKAKDHGGSLRTMAHMLVDVLDDSSTSHDGRFVFYAAHNSALPEHLRIGGGSIIVNNGQLDQDFIVRSDNQSHMLTVNGGTDRVGIKDSDPISELSVAGMISITEEQGSTPSAPADGHGFLYTKSDGKLYWRSADLGETDLTVGDTDTNTQTTYTPSVVDSSDDALIRLTAGGAGSGTQDIKLVAGTNITLTPDDTTTPHQITIASSGGLSGSGAANRLGIWTSATNISENSALNWSAASSVYKIELGVSTSSLPAIKFINNQNTAHIGISRGPNTGAIFDDGVDGDFLILSDGAHPIKLGVGNSTQIEIQDGYSKINSVLFLAETADAITDISGYGQFWVDSDDSTAKFTNDDGTDFILTRRTVTAGGNTLADNETLAIAAGTGMSIAESGGTVTFTSTLAGSGITGITVQEEGASLAAVGTTLNFVGSAVTASGTGATKTITISGGGAFARNGNIIETTETIGVGGTNAEDFSLIDVSAMTSSEAVMTASGTDPASVKTFGMGMRKNVTIVAADADTGEDTYTVADTDHIIMICNVNPNTSAVNATQTLKTVQLPQIGSSYVGRELTVTLHGLSGSIFDIINVKPASDDSILYHGRMWDNNQDPGDHNSGVAGARGGLGLTMGHFAFTDVNWAVLQQVSVVSVTMVALEAGVLAGLLTSNPIVGYDSNPTTWTPSGDAMTAGVWLVTQVSGTNGTINGSLGIGANLGDVDGGLLFSGSSGGKAGGKF